MNITVYGRAVNLELGAWYTSVLIAHFSWDAWFSVSFHPYSFISFSHFFTQATYLLFPKYKKLFLKSEPVPSTLPQKRPGFKVRLSTMAPGVGLAHRKCSVSVWLMSRFISCLHPGVTKPYLSLRLTQNASSFLKPFLDHTVRVQQIRFSRVLSLWDVNSQIRLIIIGFLISINGVFTKRHLNAFSTLICTVSHLKWAGGNGISPSDCILEL